MLEGTKWAAIEPKLTNLAVSYFRTEKIIRTVRFTADLKPVFEGVSLLAEDDSRFSPNGGVCEVSFNVGAHTFNGTYKLDNTVAFDTKILLENAIENALAVSTLDREKRDAIAYINAQYANKLTTLQALWALVK